MVSGEYDELWRMRGSVGWYGVRSMFVVLVVQREGCKEGLMSRIKREYYSD